MSVETVAQRLAQVQLTVQGIRRCFAVDDMPSAMRASYLPAFVNTPGPAEYEWVMAQRCLENRAWLMTLFVCPIEQPVDAAKKADLVTPFFRRVVSEFAKAQQLNSLSGIELGLVTNDGGLYSLEYGGAWFAGTTFNITVRDGFTVTGGV